MIAVERSSSRLDGLGKWRKEHASEPIQCDRCRGSFEIKDGLVINDAENWGSKTLRKGKEDEGASHHCREQYSRVAGEFASEGPPKGQHEKGDLSHPMGHDTIPAGRYRVFREGSAVFAPERGILPDSWWRRLAHRSVQSQS